MERDHIGGRKLERKERTATVTGGKSERETSDRRRRMKC